MANSEKAIYFFWITSCSINKKCLFFYSHVKMLCFPILCEKKYLLLKMAHLRLAPEDQISLTTFSSFRSKRPEVFYKNFALENGPPSSRGPNFPKNIFQVFEIVIQRCSAKRCSSKFRKTHRKRPLYQSLFFNKVAGLRPATLLKKRLRHMCFPLNFAKFRRTFFVAEHLQWLLLKFLRLSTWSNIALKKFLVLQLFHGFLASSHVGTS